MKNTRKLLALLMALILALGCLAAWADGEPVIEVGGEEEHGNLEPTYGEPTWEWNGDYTVATAKIPVTLDGDTFYDSACADGEQITSNAVAATCTESGKIEYTAKAYYEPLDKYFTDKKTVTLADQPALGHAYGKPV